jgi:PPM family protein phosphatase
MDNNNNSFQVVAITDTGQVRDHNEDYYLYTISVESGNWFCCDEFHQTTDKNNPLSGRLFVVADGMGGTNAGEVASKISAESTKHFFSSNFNSTVCENVKSIKNFLFSAILYSHEEIIKHQHEFPETEGMGTTIVIAWLIEVHVYIAWVGDSRCYHFSPVNGLCTKSKDHSYVQSLVDKKKITLEQAFYHPDSNIILQSLGSSDRQPKPGFNSFELKENETVLLCTDGLNGMLKDSEIEQILENETDTARCARRLVTEANNAGGNDNITIILFQNICISPRGYSHTQTLKSPFKKGSINTKTLVILILSLCALVITGYFIYCRIINPVSEKSEFTDTTLVQPVISDDKLIQLLKTLKNTFSSELNSNFISQIDLYLNNNKSFDSCNHLKTLWDQHLSFKHLSANIMTIFNDLKIEIDKKCNCTLKPYYPESMRSENTYSPPGQSEIISDIPDTNTLDQKKELQDEIQPSLESNEENKPDENESSVEPKIIIKEKETTESDELTPIHDVTDTISIPTKDTLIKVDSKNQNKKKDKKKRNK